MINEKGRVKKEAAHDRKKSNNPIETSPKLDSRGYKKITLGSKHTPKPFKRKMKREPPLSLARCLMITADRGRMQNWKEKIKNERREKIKGKENSHQPPSEMQME